jgi:small-conductance mechanosensitive channel
MTVALVVLVVAVGVGALAGRLISRVVDRFSESRAISRLVATMLKIAVILVGASVALSVVGLDRAVTSILAGAGVLGLVVGIAFQDLAANFIAGVMMGFRKPFQIDDLIETGGVMGYVRKLNLRNTLVENFDGQMVIIPNRKVFENELFNYSYTGVRRVVIPVGVRYDSDLSEVVRVATEALEALDFRSTQREVSVVARGFGASSIDFDARFWIDMPGDVGYFEATSRGVVAIKRAFDDAGISIPFPIRTVDPALLQEAGWHSTGAAAANGRDPSPESLEPAGAER